MCKSWHGAWLLGNGSFILIPVSLDLEYKYLGESFSFFLWNTPPQGKSNMLDHINEMCMKTMRKLVTQYFAPAPVIVWGKNRGFRKQPERLLATEWERDSFPTVLGYHKWRAPFSLSKLICLSVGFIELNFNLCSFS